MRGRFTTTMTSALMVVLTATTLSACALGERPTLAEQAPSGDAGSEAVMERLRRTPMSTFAASYVVSPTAAPDPVSATVTRTDDGTLTVEIGTVVFTTSPQGATRTCDVDGTNCEDFANDARISNLGITHLFWGPAFERRLSVDTARRIGTSIATDEVIAGQTAACAALRLPSTLDSVGTITYCALDEGLLARYFGADVSIELMTFSSASG